MAAIELIVGLGNPGKDYNPTRHNAGVWWLEQLSDKLGFSFKSDTKLFGKIANFSIGKYKLKAFIPNTFMNESGRAVASIAKFYKIPPEHILIAHDDLDLMPGAIRLKRGGGHGGHNGLRDIIPALGNKNFARLRIGIGHPGDKNRVSSFVLKPPTKNEAADINHSIALSLDYLEDIINGKWDKAMNSLHSLPNN